MCIILYFLSGIACMLRTYRFCSALRKCTFYAAIEKLFFLLLHFEIMLKEAVWSRWLVKLFLAAILIFKFGVYLHRILQIFDLFVELSILTLVRPHKLHKRFLLNLLHILLIINNALKTDIIFSQKISKSFHKLTYKLKRYLSTNLIAIILISLAITVMQRF